MYANLTPVTWSLLEGSSTGDISSTNVIPGRKGGEGGKGQRVGGEGMETEREVGPYPSH